MKDNISDVIAELAGFEARVAEAKQRAERVRAERNAARSALRSAEVTFSDYQERLGAGEVDDQEQESCLAEAVTTAAEAASDRLWEARLAGAERAIAEAQDAFEEFGRGHFAEIAAAEALLDGPVRDELQSAYEEFEKAEGAYVARVRRWHELRVFGGLEPADLPGNPLRGEPDVVRARFAAGIESPTPRPLVEVRRS